MILGAPGLARSVSFPPVLADVYTDKGTAALGEADTGHGWWLVENEATARLSVISGKLTNAADAADVRAGYAIASVGARVTRIGAKFTLGANTNPGGGGVGIVIWRHLLHSASSIPDAGLHLVITDVNWNLGVFENGSLAQLDTADFDLAADGETVHTVDVTIAGTVATMTLPSGLVAVSDARIASLAGPYASFETYQGDASTDAKPAFIEVWAEA
jgi:hypothetical protein